MNIPHVNAGATDHNREQTKRICELQSLEFDALGEKILIPQETACTCPGWHGEHVLVPNGSFTLDQVVGMLNAECVNWQEAGRIDPAHDGGTLFPKNGWYEDWEDDMSDALVVEADNPHDLTVAMDARIKVLEEKAGKR